MAVVVEGLFSPSSSFFKAPSEESLTFKQQYDFEKRKSLAEKMKLSYPDRIPIIVEKHAGSRTTPDITKSKFLAPGEITIAQFLLELRQHMTVDASSAIYLFFGETTPNPSALLISTYENFKDEDGFLYITYAGEKTFGC
eukprot:TRINITY_DN3945_c0_g1_i1.p1 TRINITY_DN3945_c0_g1~~TRINITY_DN3945_c0_g1_i1.p1  ORF type:complete len:140 (-),score=20.69 TRINITY_DN3945_c0_g1_i1:85-504(-)